MNHIIEKIKSARSILLSTHRQCDGDGLGAELAVYHALKKIGKNVDVVNVDATPKKYRFLNPDQHIRYFEQTKKLSQNYDLALIFDTNDERMLTPLFETLKVATKEIAYLDHHPILKNGPSPTNISWIDTAAASTGEMAYKLIKGLGIELDQNICRCLYTSITFDTQLYRYIRNSPISHQIAAELLTHQIQPDEIHRSLFGNQTVHKMAFLAKALGQIEYYGEGAIAVLRIKDADMFHYNLEPDESRDVIDMVMNIETLEAAVLFREDAPDQYKISLRSKGRVQVLDIAEHLHGGGHLYSAGAFVKGNYEKIRDQIIEKMAELLSKAKK